MLKKEGFFKTFLVDHELIFLDNSNIFFNKVILLCVQKS